MTNDAEGESSTSQGKINKDKAKTFRRAFINAKKKREPGETGGLPDRKNFLKTIVEGVHDIDTSKYNKKSEPTEAKEEEEQKSS